MPDFKPWVTGMLASMFSDLDSLTSEDGDVMARIAVSDTTGSLLQDRYVSSGRGCHVLRLIAMSRIIPNIERQMQGDDPEKTTFMIAFLSEVFKLSNPIPENLLPIYQPLIRMVAANLSFRKPQPSQPRPSFTYGLYGATRVQPVARKPALDGKLLADTLGHIMDLQFHEHGQLLLNSVIVQANSMDPEDFESTILPFLKGIVVRLLQGKNELDMYKKLFQMCLSSYVLRCVGKEPVQINWSRNPVRCSCRDCTDLNAFLRSPVDRVKRIVVSKQRRHHLHTQLDAYTDCTHITERRYIETMVVTKQGKSFEDSLKTWTNKAKSALTALRSLEDQEDTSSSPSQLRKLLGDQYDEIMRLRKVRVMTYAQQQPNQPTGSTRPMHTVAASSSALNAAIVGAPNPTAIRSEIPQVAGKKRKAVVIDLSDD